MSVSHTQYEVVVDIYVNTGTSTHSVKARHIADTKTLAFDRCMTELENIVRPSLVAQDDVNQAGGNR